MQKRSDSSIFKFLICVFYFWFFIFNFTFASTTNVKNTASIYILQFAGPISPVSAEYIITGIDKAEDAQALGILLKLDTPGGLDESMRDIIQRIFRSKIPVITYISPSGARAASAGVFITMASDIAVMASGTNIGAAHPVSVGGREVPSEMQDKIVNDAVSYIVSIAEKQNRNREWAEQAVRKSASVSAAEAVKLKVVDFIADTETELYAKLDSVLVQRKIIDKSEFAGATKKEIPMTARQRFLLFLTNPNVAYILLMLGVYGLFFELQSPGAIFPGAVGSISLLLGLYSLRLLPTNYTGLALIGLAVIFFILEVYITSFGLLTIGGISSLILGSLLLFQSPIPYFRLALSVIIAAAILTVLFFSIVVGLAIRVHKKKVTTGREGLIQKIGVATTDLDLEGTVMIHGELWNAISVDGKVNKGEKVVVIKVEHMQLTVKRST
ncbi:MAG: nodulation protein NfeD [Candidatus Latescibacteria bacterium]|nr:nodulation protein NfeD [Candidatus Latescibacterota bacterium]